MADSKTNGQELKKSALDTATQEKLNSLDNLLKMRSKAAEASKEKEDKSTDDDDLDEEGGLPGYMGIF